MLKSVFTAALCQYLIGSAHAHIVPWTQGMYCKGGNTGVDEPGTNDPVNPLYNLTKKDWWFHHNNKCDEFPPAPGEFLELPAGGNITVELATNRAFTTLSFGGAYTTEWPDGQQHSDLGLSGACITAPNIHTQNESTAAGTAFAISYQSDLAKVTPENLVVFSVLYNSPWRRLATYHIPNLPSCPHDGCTCAWGWVPNGCGEPNMYMAGYKCRVTGKPGKRAVAPAKAAVWCEETQLACTKGSKQMIYWHQLDGNNIVTSGEDLSHMPRSPAYNTKLGFKNGAQTDIFV